MRKLYKSRTDVKIDGVCGGVAEFLGIDATLVRLIWAAAVIFGGTGLFAYIICALVIPRDPGYIDQTGHYDADRERDHNRQ